MPPPREPRTLPFPNGSEPLRLSAAQRHALLAQLHLQKGWLLLSRSEMMAMRQAMEGATKENERLNGELAGMIAQKITQDEKLAALAAIEARTRKYEQALMDSARTALAEVKAQVSTATQNPATGKETPPAALPKRSSP